MYKYMNNIKPYICQPQQIAVEKSVATSQPHDPHVEEFLHRYNSQHSVVTPDTTL